MNNRRRTAWPAPVVAALALGYAGVWSAPPAAMAAGPIAQVEGVGIEQRLGNSIPLDATFRDERGELVRIGQLLDGRPVVLNLIYFECPMLCNLAMDGLIRSLRTLPYDVGDEFTMITVSFDPREGPQLAAAAKRTALKRYGRPQAEAHWHFLTGEQQEIDRLCDSVGFNYRWDSQRGQYAHAAGIIILTPQGVVSRYLLGVEYPARDVRLTLVEAGDGQVGGLTEQVMLLCYQYDPLTGRYGLMIRRVLRVGGIATVTLLATSIGVMLWQERRRRRAPTASAGSPNLDGTSPGASAPTDRAEMPAPAMRSHFRGQSIDNAD